MKLESPDREIVICMMLVILACLLLLSSCASTGAKDAYEGEPPYSDDSFEWVYETP